MKEKLPFDDFIKDQFSNYSPNVPAHILENIMAKRKSKPKAFWMNLLKGSNLIILLLVFIAGGAGYYLFSSGANNNAYNKNMASNKTAAPVKTNIVSPDKNVPEDKNNIQAVSPYKKEEGIATADNSTQTEQASENNTTPGTTFLSSFYKHSSSKIKNKGAENISKKNIDEINDQLLTTKTDNSFTTTKVFFPFAIDNARELTGLKTINSKNIKLPDCPKLEKDAAGNKKYWEVYAGPDRAFESYKTYDDTTSNNYLQKRKASTTFASAFSAGVRYTKVFDNGVSVRAGVNYSQLNEKFLYFNPNELKYVTVITTRVIIRQPGDTVYINDTLQYQQSGTRTKTTYNRYRNIDVPLVLGYEVGNGKIHANINAGVIINIYSWYKGDVLDSLYQPVSITTGKGNSVYSFKNNIGIGFLGSVSLYYRLTDNLHLLLEPYFRYNLSPMSKANLNLQQKNNTAGLRAGLRFDLK